MKIPIIIFLISVNFIAFSQIDLGIPVATGKGGAATTFVKDYEVLGINPSNLGWRDNKKFSAGILNYGFLAQSKALDLSELIYSFIYPKGSFTQEEKQNLTNLFTTTDGLNMQSNLLWCGLSVSLQKLGGVAVNLRDRVTAHFTANYNFADILFNGVNAECLNDSSYLNQPVSQVFDGTKLNFLHYRELNIGYGVKLLNLPNNTVLYGGIGYKYLWGLSFVDIKAEDENLTANTSIEKSSYEVLSGDINNYKFEKPKNLFNSAGDGEAWDFGASLIIDEKFKFGVSVVDIGSITWIDNILVGENGHLPTFDSTQTGLNSFAIKDQLGYLFNNEGLIDFHKGKSFKTALPAKFRGGMGVKVSKVFEIGIDMLVPLNNINGNLENAYFAFGGELNILGSVKISSGIAGNPNYGFNLPFGITLGTFKITEIYVATNDILTFFNKNKNPVFSFAIGVFRFNIN